MGQKRFPNPVLQTQLTADITDKIGYLDWFPIRPIQSINTEIAPLPAAAGPVFVPSSASFGANTGKRSPQRQNWSLAVFNGWLFSPTP